MHRLNIWVPVFKYLMNPRIATFGVDSRVEVHGLFTADFVIGQTYSTAGIIYKDRLGDWYAVNPPYNHGVAKLDLTPRIKGALCLK
jgi:hypothetical protein